MSGRALSIVAGYAFSCALLQISPGSNGVKCWGDNKYGQLGQGNTNNIGDAPNEMGSRLNYISLGKSKSVASVASGDYHSCALITPDNGVKCWGFNHNGQLGLGDTKSRGTSTKDMGDSLKFVNLGAGRTAKGVYAGGTSSCAILDDDSVKCWGNNRYGQLGQQDTKSRGASSKDMGDNLKPIDLGSVGLPVTQISMGGNFACALFSNGQVKCWGGNNSGELGEGTKASFGDKANTMGEKLPFINLGSGVKVVAIESGDSHTCATLSTGQLKCWGGNAMGKLGVGNLNNYGLTPSSMGSGLPAVNLGSKKTVGSVVSAGAASSCTLVLPDKRVKCWGWNYYGQLGVGSDNSLGSQAKDMGDSLPFVSLGSAEKKTPVTAIASGFAHTCALFGNSFVKCWGLGTSGQNGYGNPDVLVGVLSSQMGDSLPFLSL